MYPPQTSSESHGAGVNSFFFKKKLKKLLPKSFLKHVSIGARKKIKIKQGARGFRCNVLVQYLSVVYLMPIVVYSTPLELY